MAKPRHTQPNVHALSCGMCDGLGGMDPKSIESLVAGVATRKTAEGLCNFDLQAVATKLQGNLYGDPMTAIADIEGILSDTLAAQAAEGVAQEERDALVGLASYLEKKIAILGMARRVPAVAATPEAVRQWVMISMGWQARGALSAKDQKEALKELDMLVKLSKGVVGRPLGEHEVPSFGAGGRGSPYQRPTRRGTARRFNGNCYICGRSGHRAFECRSALAGGGGGRGKTSRPSRTQGLLQVRVD